jgi:hypothetical protein
MATKGHRRKEVAIPPEAVNPDFHVVNTITAKMDSANKSDDDWVPLSQVEHRLENLELPQEITRRNPNTWQTVARHKLLPRHMHQRDSGCRILHSIDVPSYRWQDPHRMPPRFVPKSQGNESFPRRGRTLPTLGQFIPRNWGQQPEATNNEQQGKKEGTIPHP